MEDWEALCSRFSSLGRRLFWAIGGWLVLSFRVRTARGMGLTRFLGFLNDVVDLTLTGIVELFLIFLKLFAA